MLRVIREARPTWIIGENVAGIVNMALDQVHTDLEAEDYEVESIIIPACAVDAPHRRDRVWIVGHSKLNGLAACKTIGGLFDESEEQRGKIEEWESSGTSCASSDVADTVSLSEGSAHGSKERECIGGRQEQDISQRNEVGGNSSNCGKDVADTNGGQFSECESERKSVQMSGESCKRVCDVADTVNQGWEGRVHRREDTERQGVDGHAGCCGSTHGQSGEATWLAEPNVGRVAHGIPNRVAKLRGLGNAIVPQVASEIIRCINKVMEDNK
jgi:DNA (cytosine-5)-methyltransferase 1